MPDKPQPGRQRGLTATSPFASLLSGMGVKRKGAQQKASSNTPAAARHAAKFGAPKVGGGKVPSFAHLRREDDASATTATPAATFAQRAKKAGEKARSAPAKPAAGSFGARMLAALRKAGRA